MSPAIAVLAAYLPWARRRCASAQALTTAVDRVEQHLATTRAGRDREQTEELLERRRQILQRYRELIADRDRSRRRSDRGRDIGDYDIDR